MSNLQQVENAIRDELHRQGFGEQVLWSESQILFVGYFVAQIVLRDGTNIEAARRALEALTQRLAADQVELDVQVRAKWSLESVGDVQPLYGGDGGLRAASVIPVYLKSGSAKKTANVIVTWAADKAIHEIVPQANLSAVATELVRDRLARGGESAWDPLAEPTIEVNAASAPFVSRLLRKVA